MSRSTAEQREHERHACGYIPALGGGAARPTPRGAAPFATDADASAAAPRAAPSASASRNRAQQLRQGAGAAAALQYQEAQPASSAARSRSSTQSSTATELRQQHEQRHGKPLVEPGAPLDIPGSRPCALKLQRRGRAYAPDLRATGTLPENRVTPDMVDDPYLRRQLTRRSPAYIPQMGRPAEPVSESDAFGYISERAYERSVPAYIPQMGRGATPASPRSPLSARAHRVIRGDF